MAHIADHGGGDELDDIARRAAGQFGAGIGEGEVGARVQLPRPDELGDHTRATEGSLIEAVHEVEALAFEGFNRAKIKAQIRDGEGIHDQVAAKLGLPVILMVTDALISPFTGSEGSKPVT